MAGTFRGVFSNPVNPFKDYPAFLCSSRVFSFSLSFALSPSLSALARKTDKEKEREENIEEKENPAAYYLGGNWNAWGTSLNGIPSRFEPATRALDSWPV